MNNLIIFLIPPKEVISGGIMSIFSLAEETRKLKAVHKSDVYICVYPGTKSYKKNTLFENSETIYEFDTVLAQHKNLENLLIHIPEYEVNNIYSALKSRSNLLPTNLHLNILNQNIEHMPNPIDIAELHKIADTITQTVAHQRYASQEVADKYALPTHKLTVYLDQIQYYQKEYSKKERLILYSPDDHPDKSKILESLAKNLPDYKFKEIKNLTYEEYKREISKALYTITFGEGFDGYFIEPAFSGSIPLAVYNDVFFPSKDYLHFDNVFNSFTQFEKNVSTLIKELNQKTYKDLNDKLVLELKKTYSKNIYIKNIELFYTKQYSYLPSAESMSKSLKTALKSELKNSEKLQKIIDEEKHEIYSLSLELQDRKREIAEIKGSKTWRYINKAKSVIRNQKN